MSTTCWGTHQYPYYFTQCWFSHFKPPIYCKCIYTRAKAIGLSNSSWSHWCFIYINFEACHLSTFRSIKSYFHLKFIFSINGICTIHGSFFHCELFTFIIFHRKFIVILAFFELFICGISTATWCSNQNPYDFSGRWLFNQKFSLRSRCICIGTKTISLLYSNWRIRSIISQ